MEIRYDAAIASEIINNYGAAPEMLVQILVAFVERYSYISEEAIRQIASELNLSRAEVYGVVSFYHDFRTHHRRVDIASRFARPNPARRWAAVS